jgi:predicted transcriptional regulator
MTKSNRKPQEPVALFEGLQLLRKDEIKILKCLLICDTVKDKTVKTADLISLTYAGYTETSRALNVLVKLGLMSPRLHRRGRGGAYHYTYDLERVSIVIDYLSVISTQDLGVGYKRKIGLIKICLENASKVPDSQTTHKWV